MPRLRGLAALPRALALVATLGSARAEAYVQYRTSGGVGWTWQGTSCMPVYTYPIGFLDMTANEVAAASIAAAAAWSARQHPCTYLTIKVTFLPYPQPGAVPRRLPSLVFREKQWCKLELDDTCSEAPEDVAVYDKSVLVLTSSEVNDRTGAMTRAGIEVNGVDFIWSDLVLHPERLGDSAQDLQNALTHEFGHFIGLDHNCAQPGDATLLIDETGSPAPGCDTDDPAITESTMF